MAPQSRTLAWKIPWTEEPGRLQSMGSRRVRHDRATSISLFTFIHWRRKWQRTPVFLPGESQEGGAGWAAVYGVAQSRTRLKRLSSSSSKVTFVLGPIFNTLQYIFYNIHNVLSQCKRNNFIFKWMHNIHAHDTCNQSPLMSTFAGLLLMSAMLQ